MVSYGLTGAVGGIALLLLSASCSTFNSDRIIAEGVKAGAGCIAGNGPPLTGAGHIAWAKVDKDFKGQIVITPDCGISIGSD